MKILLVTGGIALLVWGLYWLPPVHKRLSWRVDFAMAYLRGLVNPIGAPPTPLPQPQITEATLISPTPRPSKTPTPSPLPQFSPTPSLSPTSLPSHILLTPPEWERQDINNCGPTSLAMYLRFYGWEGNQTDIASLLKPYREDRNVNVEELAYYVRTRAGWLNVQYRVGGDLARIRQFLANGIPIMVEESFYFEEPFWINDDLWAAHYLLVTGYDESRQVFIGQDSFYGADREVPYETLDTQWQSFNRVFIIVYLPQQEGIVKTILGADWEADVNRQHALEMAQRETESDPQNAFAWFNLGSNLTYFERYAEATTAFDQARELGLPQRMFRYQFSPFIAYFHSNQMDDLIALTEYALKITPNSEEAWLWHGWAMYRKGDTSQAIADFERALEENPVYQDAQYALDFVRSSQ